MSPEEKEKRRHDVIVEGQFIKRKRTKKELTELLLATCKGKDLFIADCCKKQWNTY
jgi:hypothetical protein